MKGKKREKNFWGKTFPLILLSGAIALIVIFSLLKWEYADIILNIAIGLLTSSIVTIAFEKIQGYKILQEKKRKRAGFLLELKLLIYGTLDYIDVAETKDGWLTLDRYFKLQHRWFHEHFKKMYAKNVEVDETKERIDWLKWFYGEMDIHLQVILGATYDWKECYFSKTESHRIAQVYCNYRRCGLYLKKEDNLRAIYSFATFLDELRLLFSDIPELNSFDLIKVKYENNQLTQWNFGQFKEKEPYIMQVAYDSIVRRKGYKEDYGK